MDYISKKLDVFKRRVEKNPTALEGYMGTELEYFLILTFACAWDMHKEELTDEQKRGFFKSLKHLMVGDQIRILRDTLSVPEEIWTAFEPYNRARIDLLAHNNSDMYTAREHVSDCAKCWEAFRELPHYEAEKDEILRKLLDRDFMLYYVLECEEGQANLLVFGGNGEDYSSLEIADIRAESFHDFSDPVNTVSPDDVFLQMAGKYIKISPFIRYDEESGLFTCFRGFDGMPNCFEVVYLYRTNADQAVRPIKIFEIPEEWKPYLGEEKDPHHVTSPDGLTLNRFGQFHLYEQDYFRDVHQDIIRQLDAFLINKSVYSAVSGGVGVGKTSIVFQWMRNLMENREHILDKIREEFPLRRIIFLSAKTRIYNRGKRDETTGSFLSDIAAEVENYEDFVECVYGEMVKRVKPGTTFLQKEQWFKQFNNQKNQSGSEQSDEAVLLIVDDFESLSTQDQCKIAEIRKILRYDRMKLLVTKRLPALNADDIPVKQLDVEDNARMADYVFGDTGWRNSISPEKLYDLTFGVPMWIWINKKVYQARQLREDMEFTGIQNKEIHSYVFSHFLDCFNNDFSKNFLTLMTHYYRQRKVTVISKMSALFLCLKDSSEYVEELEPEYFEEFIPYNLITINASTHMVDFTPLTLYMDGALETESGIGEDYELHKAMLPVLDEERFDSLYAVLDAADSLPSRESRDRVREKLLAFKGADEGLRVATVAAMFAESDKKFALYTKNQSLFAKESKLVKLFLAFLAESDMITAASLDEVTQITQYLQRIREKLENDAELYLQVLRISARQLEYLANLLNIGDTSMNDIADCAEPLCEVLRDLKGVYGSELHQEELAVIDRLLRYLSAYFAIDTL